MTALSIVTMVGLLVADVTSPSGRSSKEPPWTDARVSPPASPGALRPEQVRWVQNRWSGVGVGYDNGIWGGHYGQTLKFSIPFGRKIGRFFGVRARAGVVHYTTVPENHYDPVINLGGELFGRTPVWWGILRAYGGGGLWAGLRPNPTEGGELGLGGGGHFGLEIFAAPFMSFTFEIGGQAPGHSRGVDGGGSAMGGLMFYFGRNDARWAHL